MDEVLHAMNRHRRCLSGKVEYALDPQDFVAVPIEQHRQPDAERRPIDGLLQSHDEGKDVRPMTVLSSTRSVQRLLPV
jgi:hypothetical protein